MLTVREALQLSVFKGAKAVAGLAGLDRPFTWVHNVGVPDAARWLNGGEFVLTTAINMPPGETAQENYLRDIIAKGVVALGISVGQYLEAIPANLRAIADEHDFPLIEVPYTLFYVEIAREINRLIAQQDLKRALEIHQALTRLVLDGGSLKELAVTLASLVHQSVSIENEHFEAFASVNIAAVDEARRYTQQYGRTDPRLVQALQDRGYLPEIQRTLRPVNLPQMPDVGLEMERILAPIVVHGEIIGYVWIIADERPLGDLERMAIDAAATIAALMLLRQDAVQREEAAQRGDLLIALMQAAATSARTEVLIDRALRYGVDLRQPFRIIVIDSADRRLTTRQYQQIVVTLDSLKIPVIVGRFSGMPVILTAADADRDKLMAHIKRALTDVTVKFGISGTHRGVYSVAQAYTESQESLDIISRIDPDESIAAFEGLGYLYTLYKAGKSALEGNPHVATVRLLRDDRTGELFDTLEAYLDAGGNGVATAEALHIHRSTLNYRLGRIAEICGAELSDPQTRMNLQIALKMLRLFE